jgi:hypothetical protein
MKLRSLLVIIPLLLIAAIKSNGQALLTQNDSIPVRQDTTIRFILKDYRGTVQWQKSPDNIIWNNISGKNTNSLVIKPDQEAFYRAFVKEGNCNPVYSDSAVVIFTIPAVSTSQAQEISSNSALLGGKIVSTGGILITEYGVCYSQKQNPTVLDIKVPITGFSV